MLPTMCVCLHVCEHICVSVSVSELFHTYKGVFLSVFCIMYSHNDVINMNGVSRMRLHVDPQNEHAA